MTVPFGILHSLFTKGISCCFKIIIDKPAFIRVKNFISALKRNVFGFNIIILSIPKRSCLLTFNSNLGILTNCNQ